MEYSTIKVPIDCLGADIVRWAGKPVRKAVKIVRCLSSSAQRCSEFVRFPPLSRLFFELSGRSLDLFCLLFCVKAKRVSGARAKPSYYGLPTTPSCGHPSSGGEFAAQWIVGVYLETQCIVSLQSRNWTDFSLRSEWQGIWPIRPTHHTNLMPFQGLFANHKVVKHE